MLTCKYLVYFILLFLVFSVDYLGVDDRNCNRRGRAHWRRPRRKAEAAEAGAEGKSFDSCFVFLIFAYLCYFLDFIIIFFVVAAEVLVEVDHDRRGRSPALDHRGTQMGWQQLWLHRPYAWAASKAPLYGSGGRGRGKRLQKLTALRAHLW